MVSVNRQLRQWFGRLRGRTAQARIAIGFLPTVDAASLVVARERGFFADEGLEVELQRDTSWHHLRARLCEGQVVAAHLPATVALTTTLGIDCTAQPLCTGLVLSLNGATFGLQPPLAEALGARNPLDGLTGLAKRMAAQVQQRRERGEPRLRFAVSGLASNGSYDLRHWLAEGGVDPAHDIELVPLTPARVLSSLRAGRYDGAYLDEPFATEAFDDGVLTPLFSKHEFWNNSLAKVLAVRAEWSDNHPSLHRRLLRALMSAASWLEGHRDEAAELLALPAYLNSPAERIRRALQGSAQGAATPAEAIGFDRYAAGFPWYSQAVWYLGQMVRWGDYADVLDFKKTAQTVFSPRMYREAARDLGMPYPTIGYKDEGLHDEEWELDEASRPILLGPDQFFDQRLYRPRQTMKYLNGLAISHVRAPLEAMWAIR